MYTLLCRCLSSGEERSRQVTPQFNPILKYPRLCLELLNGYLFITPGSPWENGYIESFNGKLRDELLNREIFTTLTKAKLLTADWKKEYNQVRLHGSKGYRPPAPEAKILVTLT